MAPGLVAAAVAIALATGFGFWWRARNGRVRSLAAAAGDAVTGSDLGSTLGSAATLVQFSSAVCAPCRATRQILAEVAAATAGVSHVEVDADARLDLARRLRVRRVPTTLVLGPDGRIAYRVSGQPRKADIVEALAPVVASLQK